MASVDLCIIEMLVALITGVSYIMKIFKQKSPVPEFGISILYRPPASKESSIDIVFVHGLGANSRTAWSDGNVFWPSSELPMKLAERGLYVTIAAYDYDSKFRTAEYLTRRTLLHQAEKLIEDLAKYRHRNFQRPTIFVCHSLGGLLVKNALVSARASKEDRFQSISNSVAGIVFLGTPHCSSPKALADKLCTILGLKTDSKMARDLGDRSTTFACNLERFKPLAALIPIRDFVERRNSLSEDKSSSEHEAQNTGIHQQYLLTRKHHQLCKFSTPNDADLKRIIKSIEDICSLPAKGPLSQPIKEQNTFGYDRVCDLGLDKILAQRCASIREKPVLKAYSELKSYFTTLKAASNRTMSMNKSTYIHDYVWSVAILEGGSVDKKTQATLQYVDRHFQDYGSILWINATNEKSLELSFRDIAGRMISNCADKPESAAREIGLEGIDLKDEKNLEGEDFHTVVLSVTEWLARPRKKKWLLVLDGLSLEVGYPATDNWTGHVGQKQPNKRSWGSILPLLPSTANERGDIIISTRVISTRDRIVDVGCKVIRLPPVKSSKREPENVSFELTTPYPKTIELIAEWWKTASEWERHVLETVQFLSDKNCRRVPCSLFETTLPDNGKMKKLSIPELSHQGSFLQPSESLVELGPRFFYFLGLPSLNQAIKEAAKRSWKALDHIMESARGRPDLIFTWDKEAQMVMNIQAALGRCRDTLTEDDLKDIFSFTTDRKWAKLAVICENHAQNHAQFGSAVELYQLEQSRHSPGTEAYFSLELDCARVYQHCGKESSAESAYKRVCSEKYANLSFHKREAACRQFASFLASKHRFREAAERLISVLALEDPFGGNTGLQPATDSVMEIAAYLEKDGNKAAASALLQRRLVSLEDTSGSNHPKTLAIMETLSAVKLEEGDLKEARLLLNHVHDCQKKRLGEQHPTTIRCGSKVAATWDLEGQTKEAEAKYLESLDIAAVSLGSHHPVVSGIREDFVLFLLTQGKNEEAREELDTLLKEAETFRGLYPPSFLQRIHRLRDPKLDVDDLDQNMLFVRRNTLGAGGLYSNHDDDDDYYYNKD